MTKCLESFCRSLLKMQSRTLDGMKKRKSASQIPGPDHLSVLDDFKSPVFVAGKPVGNQLEIVRAS